MDWNNAERVGFMSVFFVISFSLANESFRGVEALWTGSQVEGIKPAARESPLIKVTKTQCEQGFQKEKYIKWHRQLHQLIED